MSDRKKVVRLAAMLLVPGLLMPVHAQEAETPVEAPINVDKELAEGLAAFNSGDLIGAMSRYRRAANSGSTEAKVRLAWILDQSEDNAGALRLYSEAAEAGDPAGQFGLAELYANGEGVKRDVRRAVKLFEAAAANGYPRAMMVLASAYREGGLGLVPSTERAEFWENRLADTVKANVPDRTH